MHPTTNHESVKQIATITTRHPRRSNVPSTARDALVALATLLAPDVPDVAAHVTNAHDDPDGYHHAHADRLDERGIDEPVPELAWIALVDALTDHHLLAEVDWKEAAGEIIAQL